VISCISPVIEQLTYNDVPVLGDVSDLIGRAHLGVGDSTNDKDDEAWTGLGSRLTGPFLVPLSIPRTDTATEQMI